MKLSRFHVLCANLIALTCWHPTMAAPQGEADYQPCAYQEIDYERWGGHPLVSPPTIHSIDGELDTRLQAVYGEHTIAGCPTSLRLYNGELIGPTLRLRPGDTLNVTLLNRLPPNQGPPPEDPNIPHAFNTTNLHTHGLHVTPTGNGDNVLLRIDPSQHFTYEIKIPRDHPTGTFWYHPHVHGSTAIQVGSGMAGALIVEGGIDDLPAIQQMKERILLFQQIPYDPKGQVEIFKEAFGPGKWQKSQRRTTINGQIFPVIHMRPGEIQRWRLIHGGVRESIELSLDDHQLQEVAVDGLVTGRIDSWSTLELQPGYRSDVLVRAASLPKGVERREYLLRDGASPATRSLLAEQERPQVLAKVVVEGAPVEMKLPAEAALRRFVPFAPVQRTDGSQTVVFNIDNAGFTINGRPFSHDHRRVLELGRTEEWTLSSKLANHPFHIHVNPFEHWRVGPDGERQRVWRDTLLVRRNHPETIRTRYEKYVGTFVLHCHILDHEDQGMMELVEIRLPDIDQAGHDALHKSIHRAHSEPKDAIGSEVLAQIEPTNGDLRVRRNIDDLSEEELGNYLHAIHRLKEISKKDPLSKDGYSYFAALHNEFRIGPCEHQTDTFLPWHRAHLMEFEDALRRSDLPRTANVTVPYWDWTKVPSGKRYPKAFEDPNSEIHHPGRATTPICRDRTSGHPPNCVRLPFPWRYMDREVLSVVPWSGSGIDGFGGESNEALDCRPRQQRGFGALEQPAHNDMHSQYVVGDMRSPNTAANDPIFWSFHAFVDLLWDQWQQREERNVDTCLDCRLCGLMHTHSSAPWTVKQTVDRSALGYEYDFSPAIDSEESIHLAAAPGVFEIHPAVDFAITGKRDPDFIHSLEILVPDTLSSSTTTVHLEAVPISNKFSYQGNAFLHPIDVPFRPRDKDFRERYLVEIYSIWMGHDHGDEEHGGDDNASGHGADHGSHGTSEIILDLSDEMTTLVDQHAGESWVLTIAVGAIVPEESTGQNVHIFGAEVLSEDETFASAVAFEILRLEGLK